MALFLIILSGLLWLLSLAMLRGRQLAAPLLSYGALFLLSLAHDSAGYQLLPINTMILTGWGIMTAVVAVATSLQPAAILSQTKGWLYIAGGAVTGMVTGLLGPSVSSTVSIGYGIMIFATVIGTFLGFLLYTRTPDGRPVAPGTGHFFRFLLAKGFPTAITVMMIGVALTLVIYVTRNING